MQKLAFTQPTGLVEGSAVAFSPGVKVSTNLYPTNFNTVAELTHSEARSGATYIDANANFGSAVNVTMSNNTFLTSTFLRLQLPAVPADVYLPEGWGLMAIESMRFQMNSTTRPEVTTVSLFHKLMLDTVTNESRNGIIQHAGAEVISAQAAGTVNEAIIPINLLPFATTNGLNPAIPFDAKSLQSGIVITIKYNFRQFFMGGNGAAAWATGIASRFSQAIVYTRDTIVSSRSAESDIGDQAKQGAIELRYPFTKVGRSTQTLSMTAANPTSVTFRGLENGDLMAIAFTVVPNIYLAAEPASNPLSMLDSLDLTDVRLVYNGISVLESPSSSQLDRAFNLRNDLGTFEYNPKVRDAATGVGPFYTHFTKKRLYVWNVSLNKSTLNASVTQATKSFNNNDFTLTMTGAYTGNVTLFLTFLYPAIAVVSGGKTVFIE